MKRRTGGTLTGWTDLYLFLVLLSAALHLDPQFLSRGPTLLDTSNLSYLLVIYLGYKFGRYWGALGGLISSGIWCIAGLLFVPELTAGQLLFARVFPQEVVAQAIPALPECSILYASLQHVILYCALGFLAGVLMDRLETLLAHRGLTLEELLPKTETLYLKGIGHWVRRLVEALFLLQLDPKDKKGVLLLRLRKLFVILVTLPLLVLFNALSLRVTLPVTEFLTLNVVPAVMAPVIALWIAYTFGARAGVFAAASLCLTPLAHSQYRETLGEIGLQVSPALTSPDGVLALAVAAWVIGTAGRALQGEALRGRLLPATVAGEGGSAAPLGVLHVGLLILLSLELSYGTETLKIYQQSPGILALYILWLSRRFPYRQVSNTVLIVLGTLLLVHFRIPADPRVSDVSLRVGNLMVHEVVFLALIPIALARVTLDSLARTRTVLAAVFIGYGALYILFSTRLEYLAPSLLVNISIGDLPMPLLSLLGIAVLLEGGARVLWVTNR